MQTIRAEIAARVVLRRLRLPEHLRLSSPRFGSVVVSDRGRIFKIGFGRNSTIEREYRNGTSALARWPRLATVLPALTFAQTMGIRHLSMEHFQSLPSDGLIPGAVAAFSTFRECGSAGTGRLRWSESSELAEGYRVLEALFGDPAAGSLRGMVEGFLEAGGYHLGFAHGDFHARNIMRSRDGAVRVIDLDCARLRGIQELDALYFALESSLGSSGPMWHARIGVWCLDGPDAASQAILDRFGVEFSVGLAATYLVDRLGQESGRFRIGFTSGALAPALKAVLTGSRR